MNSRNDLVCYVAFATMLAISIHDFIRNLIWAEELAREYRATLATRMPWQTVAKSVTTLLCYLIAYFYADLRYLWLALSVTGVATTMFFYAGRAGIFKFPIPALDDDAQALADRARQLRKWTAAEPVFWVLWLYAWRHLFNSG
jgi:hypothetical protein